MWSAVSSKARGAAKSDPALTVDGLRRQFVYDRLLARVFAGSGGQWVLKGGTALLARVRSARHSQDIDLFHRSGTLEVAVEELRSLAALDLNDHFRFVTGQVVTHDEGTGPTGRQLATLHVSCYVGVSRVEEFTVDLVVGCVITGPPEVVDPRVALDIPELSTPRYLLYPVTDHIADKVCATFDLYGTSRSPSSRVRDLVDLVVIARTQTVRSGSLAQSIRSEQVRRELAPIGHFVTPSGWRTAYAGIARDVVECSGHRSYAAAISLVEAFLDPVLTGDLTDAEWEPQASRWVPSA